MIEPRARVFFYGSYMNLEILAQVGLAPGDVEPAALAGFDIQIAPRANLVRDEAGLVLGVLASATHAELALLYTHARDVLGEVYLPEAVLARARHGAHVPALCYICPAMVERPAEPAYVERIVAAARHFGFPEAYVERLRSFAP